MDWLQVFLLALVQGFTEFLPISSSGHLVLPAELFGWPDQGLAFDVAVHVGSLTAVLLYFRRDIIELLRAWAESFRGRGDAQQARLAWMIILGTIPAGLAGLLLDDWIEANLRSLSVIATTTIVFGLLLGAADRLGRRALDIYAIGWRLALIIGLAQVLALIPGTSRSGITITAALFLGLSRDASARFSFLLSIPLICAAGGLKSLQLMAESAAVPWLQIAVATVVSALTAYACIYAFLAWLERIGMLPFVIYRLILGAFLFYLVAA